MSAKPLLFAASLVTLAALGCEAPDLPAIPIATQVAEETPADPATPPPEVGVNGSEVPPMEKPVTKTPRKFIASDPKFGRRFRQAGAMGVPFKAGAYAKFQTLILNLQHNLDIWSAAQGLDVTYPKSHEQYMKEIVEPLGMALPELDEQVEYIYVPEQGEKGLQIRLKPDYPGDIWPPGSNPADAVDDAPEPIVQPNQPNQPTDRAIGVQGAGAAAGVAPLDLQ